MAFKYAKTDRRGNPRIVRVDGYWIALHEYFTDTKKLASAHRHCERLNWYA